MSGGKEAGAGADPPTGKGTGTTTGSDARPDASAVHTASTWPSSHGVEGNRVRTGRPIAAAMPHDRVWMLWRKPLTRKTLRR